MTAKKLKNFISCIINELKIVQVLLNRTQTWCKIQFHCKPFIHAFMYFSYSKAQFYNVNLKKLVIFHLKLKLYALASRDTKNRYLINYSWTSYAELVKIPSQVLGSEHQPFLSDNLQKVSAYFLCFIKSYLCQSLQRCSLEKKQFKLF